MGKKKKIKRLGFPWMPHSPGYILLDAVKAPLGTVLADIGEIKCEGPHFRRSIGPRDRDVLLGTGGGTLVTRATPGWAEIDSPAARMLWGILQQGKHLAYCTERLQEEFKLPPLCAVGRKGNRGKKEQLKMDMAVTEKSCLSNRAHNLLVLGIWPNSIDSGSKQTRSHCLYSI